MMRLLPFLRRVPRHLARTVIYLAAAAMASWSLYVVAHDIYGVPKPLAVLVAAVFDGAALACLNLASEAVSEGRSAAGPRAATLALAGVSVYLNITHAQHIGGGVPAALLFASPTGALLLVSDLTWAATRAQVRSARGERPMTLPVFGAWGWLLARKPAWKATKAKAAAHVEHGGTFVAQTATQPERHSATEVLRARFAEMDPADAVRIAADAQPELPPAELASLLVGYGVIVDAVQVALVLSSRGPRITVERGDAAPPDPDAEQVKALPPASLSGAIVNAAAALGPDAKAADIARLIETRHRITVDESYVRTALSRENKRAGGDVGQGGGGYA